MSGNDGETAGEPAETDSGNGSGSGAAGHLDPEAIARLERQGGPGLKRKMILRFLENTSGKLVDAREALAASKQEEFGRSLHKLRSTTLMMGALRMSELCQAGELMARASQLDGGDALLDGLDGEFQRIRPWFKSFLEDPST
jgi:HPt (histidine-containing phosphotransfer) domain-containing protein